MLYAILIASVLIGNSFGYLGGDLPQPSTLPFDSFNIDPSSNIIKVEPRAISPPNTISIENSKIELTSEIIKFDPRITLKHDSAKRYLIFGSGALIDENKINDGIFESVTSQNGFFSVGVLSEKQAHQLKNNGHDLIEDFLLDFHSINNSDEVPEISKIAQIMQSADSLRAATRLRHVRLPSQCL